MEMPETSELTLEILILRTVGLSQKDTAEIAQCRPLKVVEVSRWFRDKLSYQEAVAFVDDEAIKRLVARVFGSRKLKKEVLEKA